MTKVKSCTMWKVLLIGAVLFCTTVFTTDSDTETEEPTLDFGTDTTSCLDDPNAYIGCAGRCHRTCDDYKKANLTYLCPHACFPACDCLPDFVYEKTSKRCIKREECPQSDST